MADTFGALGQLDAGGATHAIARLDALAGETDVARLPYTLRVLLENVLRAEALGLGSEDEVRAVAGWDAHADPSHEISFRPARVLLQDFTGVPAIVDLAAMREAMVALGGDAAAINPQIPAELVIDHSVQVDEFGSRFAILRNTEREFERNRERYAFLRWGQTAFDNFSVVPPNTGIVHQVNLEYLARVVETREEGGRPFAFPDTLIGTDSHTTMVNGLGVLGWGVGGIEAEAVLLGEPVSMLVPQVVGFRLTGKLPEGATATDLVLAVTQILRSLGVVGKFVEYFGHGLVGLPLADRATIGNMSPEYGATCGFFPVDEETLRYLRLTGPQRRAGRARGGVLPRPGPLPRARRDARVLADRRARPRRRRAEPRRAAPAAGPRAADARRSRPSWSRSRPSACRTGTAPRTRRLPTRSPRATLRISPSRATSRCPTTSRSPSPRPSRSTRTVAVSMGDESFELEHGAVVIAAITSCTNTSNPSVMVAAGLLAKNAVERGLARKPWVKSSLAPGSQRRHRVLRQGGPDAVPRGARVPHRRLRLHDLHRQLGAAPAGDLRGRSTTASSSSVPSSPGTETSRRASIPK